MQGICKNCKFEGSILKHISRNKTCFEKYHKEELDALDRKKKEIKNEKQRLQYSPNKRRQAYLIKVDKKKSSLHLDTSNTSENKMLIKDATKDNDSKNIVKWTEYRKDLKGRRIMLTKLWKSEEKFEIQKMEPSQNLHAYLQKEFNHMDQLHSHDSSNSLNFDKSFNQMIKFFLKHSGHTTEPKPLSNNC